MLFLCLFLRLYYPSVWEDKLWSKHNLYDTHFSTGAIMINTYPEIGYTIVNFNLLTLLGKNLENVLPQKNIVKFINIFTFF